MNTIFVAKLKDNMLEMAEEPVKIPESTEWQVATAKLASAPSDMHNLVVVLPEKNPVEIDWVSFE